MLGAVPAERIAALYAGADLFVLASRFEGYGMAFAEALAHGLPVIGTTAGAIPDTVPPDAGVLVEPNDVKALTRALRMLIENPKERQWLASGAREAGAALPTWDESGEALRRRDRGAGMSFSAAWLELREPYDRRARNAAVIDAVAAALAGRPSVTIVDLACGTGSTFRALTPLHQGAAELAAGRQRSQPAGPRAAIVAPDINVTTMPIDLNRDLEAALDGPVDLVTTSALLDLVSDEWLERLVVETAARRLPVYAALSYDGRIEMTPGRCRRPDDHRRRQRASAHRQGLRSGARPGRGAAGDRAVRARRLFGGAGRVRLGVRRRTTAKSSSRCCRAGPRRRARSATCRLPDVVGWLTRRRDLVAAGRSSIRVGHVDFFARPTGTR